MKKTLLMLVTLLCAMAAQASVTIKYDNTKNWDKVYLWAWVDGQDGADFVGTGWPGVEMTKGADGIFTYTFENAPEKLIFSNGSGTQSGDIDYVEGATYNFDGVAGAPVDPYTALYVRGGMNNWGSGSAWKLATTDGVTYTFEGNIAKDTEFKIAESTWDGAVWGADGSAKLTVNDNTTVTLKNSTGTQNLIAGDDITKLELNTTTGLLTVGTPAVTPEPQPTPGENVYYVLGANPTIPTTFYGWYQMNGDVTMGTYNNAPTYTVTTNCYDNVNAASCGWLSEGFDVSPILTGDYNLVFDFKTAAASTMAVKLVPDGQDDNGNETAFEYTGAGEWQTITMNVKDKFPRFAASGATDGKVYVFALVAGTTVATGDTYTVANVRYVKEGYVEPTPEPEPTPAVDLYVRGTMNEWGSPEEWMLATTDDETYTLECTIPAEAKFKVGSADWETSWGGEADITIDADGTYTLVNNKGSKNIAVGAEVEITEVSLNTATGELTVKTKGVEGIETIEAANAAAVYYNLQGVRVANPRGGIFVKVAGNTVTKVIVK